ncbi:MAG: SpoIIE family protein phosphatase [Anaerolineae bacterium]|nr:SpoIIE family protein phosphatase [Anaerolineae bacterium]
MLTTILANQQHQIEALAEDWLSAGATSFSIWSDDLPLKIWPQNSYLGNDPLIQEIKVDAIKVGELRVTGLNSKPDQERLQAQANLLAQIARLERDLNSMAVDLIDTQDQLLALYELTQATRNFLEIDQTLARLALETTRLLKVEGAFFLVEMGDRPPIIEYFPHPILEDDVQQNYIDALVASNHGFLCRRIVEEENVLGEVKDSNLRNILLVPINVRNAQLAVFGLLNKLDGEFTSPDIKLARAVAEFTGAQIENVIMYQLNMEQAKLKTEMDLAKRIQDHLIPQNQPRVEGIDLWASSRSASQVGGDFYDFIMRRDQPFTFSVGDISGKGIPAALLMAMTRTVIRTKTNVVMMPSPELILRRTNEELYDDFTELSMFATVFVGQYHPEKRQLLYANAGHSPVIYCPMNGKARLLQADGMPVGIMPISLSEDHSLNFGPGDLLVVATDGFSEARNRDGKEFGYDELTALVQTLVDLPAYSLAKRLHQIVEQFSGGEPQSDDQTLVVLKGV